MNILPVADEHTQRVAALFAALPDGDITFMKEDVPTAETVGGWVRRPSQEWVALDGEAIVGIAALPSLTGWSDHVCELRLVVHPEHRRAGVGRALTQHALISAMRAGKRKVIVELAADQEEAARMFTSLGFEGEALLRDHFRDRHGRLQDLMMLACFVDASHATFDVLGILDELG